MGPPCPIGPGLGSDIYIYNILMAVRFGHISVIRNDINCVGIGSGLGNIFKWLSHCVTSLLHAVQGRTEKNLPNTTSNWYIHIP